MNTDKYLIQWTGLRAALKALSSKWAAHAKDLSSLIEEERENGLLSDDAQIAEWRAHWTALLDCRDAVESLLKDDQPKESGPTDKERVDWLHSLFSGTFRESMFIANPIGNEDGRVMLDRRNCDAVFANTVREVIDLAMKEK